MENEYTSLARRFTEEHIYDEVHRYVGDLDSDSDTQSLRELGVCTAVPPPRKLDPRRLEKSHADKKARKFSPRQDRKAPKSNEGSPRRFPFPKLGKALKGKGGGKGKEEKDGKKKKKEGGGGGGSVRS
nr:hypothetical protein BaRGS_021584 [Batillaria attramentaria]